MQVFLISLCLLATSPETLLLKGEEAIQRQDWKTASSYFNKALDTNGLSEAGRAIVYWDIFTVENKLKDLDKSMSALFGFFTYADIADSSKLYEKWFEQFKINDKSIYGFNLVQAKWAGRNNYSCRDKMFACYIYNEKYIPIFIEEVPFCKRIGIKSIQLIKEDGYTRLNVTCNSSKLETYYFIVNDSN